MQVALTPAFLRKFKKLPAALQEEALEKIELFQEDPQHKSLKTHKLKGRLAGRWSFSVNYQYRIVFQYLTKEEIILLAIGNHDVYDR